MVPRNGTPISAPPRKGESNMICTYYEFPDSNVHYLASMHKLMVGTAGSSHGLRFYHEHFTKVCRLVVDVDNAEGVDQETLFRELQSRITPK